MKVIRFCLLLLFCAYSQAVFSAHTRRHIIILQDNSGSYFNQHNSQAIERLQNSIVDLFLGEQISSGYCLYNSEIKNNIPFFDPDFDKISFFWFVAGQRDNCTFYNSNGGYSEFEKGFLTPGYHVDYDSNKETVDAFIRENFKHKPIVPGASSPYPSWMKTYSFTAFSYPLCLDVLHSDYASEYLIIIVSDFKAGSTFGNVVDKKIFTDAFQGKGKQVLDRVDWLDAQFFKVAYLDYNINVGGGSNVIGLTSFKIKPNVGDPIVESVDLRINSNIKFLQNNYGEDSFLMNESEVIFGHNNKLSIDQVLLSFDMANGQSSITKDVTDLVNHDPESHSYKLSEVPNVVLQGLRDSTGVYDGVVKYIFNTSYLLGDSERLKYRFEVSRSINADNFTFKTKLSNQEKCFMILAVIFILALLIYAILLVLGKPIDLLLKWNRFNDNYETVDFSTEGSGRIHTDYAKWVSAYDSAGIIIPVTGRLKYKKSNRFYNWKGDTGYPVSLTPQELSAPEGFSMFITAEGKVSSSPQMPIEISSFSDGEFKFNIVLKKISNIEIVQPLFIVARIEAICQTSGFLRKFYVTKEMTYEFHIGQNLGQVWIGVDPGTTGSCIATATSSQDMLIEQRNGEDYIAPSVISINPASMTDGSEGEIRKNTLFGGRANAIRDSKRKKFVSIKKLLGYNKNFELKPGISVNSSFLSTLLIEGLLRQNKEYIEQDAVKLQNQQFFVDGTFTPKRAVFAIPNNFTASKIQQLKDCIAKVQGNSLKEVRFIYEAEAILVNYINTASSKTDLQESKDGETIFIFDMGGATINATLANIKRRKRGNNNVYLVDIMAKLGYGIGGDTIDYAYLKWIFSRANDYHVLAQNNPFLDNSGATLEDRRKLKEEALKLKISTIKNYSDSNQTQLIDRLDLTKFNSFNLDPEINGSIEDDPFAEDIKKGTKAFLNNEFFKEYVWDNIDSICKDVMTICQSNNVTSLDTVIMSGRSSHFPKVSEIVKETIKKSGYDAKIWRMKLVESKSAVAKGACYYGIQNANFILKNRTVNGAFGVIQTLGAGQNPEFHRLVSDGATFDENGVTSGTKQITSSQDFSWDGRTVKFCQVMGVNPEEVINKRQKHKYTEVATILADPYAIKSVRIDITEKDKVYCSVTDVNGNVNQPIESTVNDADIMTSNDEQYTFFVAQS